MRRSQTQATRRLALAALVVSRLAAVVRADCLTAPTSVSNVRSVSNPIAVAGGSYAATYTCLDGYEFWSADSSTYNRLCSGGVWETISNCQPVHCPALPLNAATMLSTTDSTFGTVVIAGCQTAYQITGLAPGQSLSVTCQSNKEWNSTIGSSLCVSIRCNHPAIGNATWNNASYAVASTTTVYTCLPGYFFTGGATTYTFLCSSLGAWSPSNIFCNPVHCPTLTIPNGAVDNPNATAYPSVVHASCLKGYYFADGSVAPSLTCTSDGTWTPAISQCLPVACPAPPSPSYAVYNANVSATFGNSINYSCIDGYFFADRKTWRLSACNELSLWSPVVPSCLPADQLPQPDFKHVVEKVEAPDGLGASSLPIGLAGSVLAIVLILDIITFPIQVAYVKKNFKAFMDSLKPPEPEPEPVELHFPSVISLGRGRVTPAPSVTDLGFVRDDDAISGSLGGSGGEPTSPPPFGDKQPLLRFAGGEAPKASAPESGTFRPAAAAATTGGVAAKRERLQSAKRSVQHAIEMATLANNLSFSSKPKRNAFVPNILPLHASNVNATRGTITVSINEGYEGEAEKDVDDDDDDDDTDDESDDYDEPARNGKSSVPGQLDRSPA